MVAWEFMILKPSAKFRELNSGGGGSRNRQLPGLSFGNKSMPRMGRRRIISKCQDRLGAHTFRNMLGRIKELFSNTVSGKSEQGIVLNFGRIARNRNPS